MLGFRGKLLTVKWDMILLSGENLRLLQRGRCLHNLGAANVVCVIGNMTVVRGATNSGNG